MNGFYWDLTDFMVNLSPIHQSMIGNRFKIYSITIWFTVIIIVIIIIIIIINIINKIYIYLDQWS